MTVWRVAAVDQEPQTTLVQWQVMELPDGSRHLVGYAVEAREGRVSSRVETFDPATLRAATGSGRVYRLTGRPGCNGDAQYVWNAWLRLNEASAYVDVSSPVWAAFATSNASTPVIDRSAGEKAVPRGPLEPPASD